MLCMCTSAHVMVEVILCCLEQCTTIETCLQGQLSFSKGQTIVASVDGWSLLVSYPDPLPPAILFGRPSHPNKMVGGSGSGYETRSLHEEVQ